MVWWKERNAVMTETLLSMTAAPIPVPLRMASPAASIATRRVAVWGVAVPLPRHPPAPLPPQVRVVRASAAPFCPSSPLISVGMGTSMLESSVTTAY
jgi:hypothetical protein